MGLVKRSKADIRGLLLVTVRQDGSSALKTGLVLAPFRVASRRLVELQMYIFGVDVDVSSNCLEPDMSVASL